MPNRSQGSSSKSLQEVRRLQRRWQAKVFRLRRQIAAEAEADSGEINLLDMLLTSLDEYGPKQARSGNNDYVVLMTAGSSKSCGPCSYFEWNGWMYFPSELDALCYVQGLWEEIAGDIEEPTPALRKKVRAVSKAFGHGIRTRRLTRTIIDGMNSVLDADAPWDGWMKISTAFGIGDASSLGEVVHAVVQESADDEKVFGDVLAPADASTRSLRKASKRLLDLIDSGKFSPANLQHREACRRWFLARNRYYDEHEGGETVTVRASAPVRPSG